MVLTLYKGRLDDVSERLDKQIRTYDFLDSLEIEYDRADHEAADNYELLSQAVNIAEEMGITIHVGNVVSTDMFYSALQNPYDPWKNMGVLAEDMETAGLYINAARANKHALSLLTVTDHMYTGESITTEARELKLGQMVEIALNLA